MKTRYFAAFSLLVLLAAVSCQKEAGNVTSKDGDFGKGEKMTFRAYASPVVKSHLESSDDYTENEGTLYWDTTDQVGILSIYLNNEGEDFASRFDSYWEGIAAGYADGDNIGITLDKYITSALTSVVPDGSPSSSATLYSSLSKEDWFANTEEAEEGKAAYYDFVGIYPMTSAPEFRVVAKTSTGKAVLGIPVNNISSYQQHSEGFGKYHVCFDNGLDMSDEASYGLYTSAGVIDGSETVSFNDFTPMTALLQFDIRTDCSAPVLLQEIRIHAENRDVPLCGNAYVISDGPVRYIYQYDGYQDTQVQLSLHDGSNYPYVTSSSDGTIYSVVVLPSYKRGVLVDGRYYSAPDFCNSYGGETLVFEGYDVYGEKVFEAKKVMPEYGFEPGKRYCFTLDFESVESKPLPGQFTVSESGKKVSFSRGNLVYRGTWNDYNRHWHFHTYQYDRYFWWNQTGMTFNEDSYLDLFGWATAGVYNPGGDYGADEGHTAYRPWAYSMDPHAYGPSLTTLEANTSWAGQSCEPYCEWGKNPNLVTWLGEGWRTLSRDEWEYLLNRRAVANRFIKGTANEYPGLFIFPDDYSGDMSAFDSSKINAADAAFDGANINYNDFLNIYQPSGLVFLPAVGLREGGDISEYNSLGAYWSSVPAADSEDAYALAFSSDEIVVERYWRPLGLSVRLVKDVE